MTVLPSSGQIHHGTSKVQNNRDHASVTLPGVLQTNVGNSNLRCNLKKIISADITAFEPGTSASSLVEHVDSVTGFLEIFSPQGACA